MIFVTWWTFQTCCSLLGMLGIFGEVGRPNSMKPLPSPKFLRPIPRLFLEQIFLGRYRDFFWDQNFRDRDRYSQKIEKSLDTEKSRDEMSHSDQNDFYKFEKVAKILTKNSVKNTGNFSHFSWPTEPLFERFRNFP